MARNRTRRRRAQKRSARQSHHTFYQRSLSMESLEARILLAGVNESITVDAPAQVNGLGPPVWIDALPTGNTATSLDTTETCRQVTGETDSTFDVDVVVSNGSKLSGFVILVHFDSKYVSFKEANSNFLLPKDGGRLEVLIPIVEHGPGTAKFV